MNFLLNHYFSEVSLGVFQLGKNTNSSKPKCYWSLEGWMVLMWSKGWKVSAKHWNVFFMGTSHPLLLSYSWVGPTHKHEEMTSTTEPSPIEISLRFCDYFQNKAKTIPASDLQSVEKLLKQLNCSTAFFCCPRNARNSLQFNSLFSDAGTFWTSWNFSSQRMTFKKNNLRLKLHVIFTNKMEWFNISKNFQNKILALILIT